MTLTTPDVIGLLGLALIVVFWGWSVRRNLRILDDPDHPHHEMVKEAIQEEYERAERDRLRFP